MNTDQELHSLLQSGKWCTSMASTTGTIFESASFDADGMLRIVSGFSSPSGSGNTTGRALHWKVEGGLLKLSQDGNTWTEQAIAVTETPSITFDALTWGRCT